MLYAVNLLFTIIKSSLEKKKKKLKVNFDDKIEKILGRSETNSIITKLI